MEVRIGISARHIHLKREHLDKLFGENYELNKLKELSQPGEFGAVEQLTIKTERNKIEKVRILGPLRDYTQIEISKTDAYFLGINPPIRDSGDVENSSPITLVGPLGELYLESGCIIPTRHIHTHPDNLIKYNLDSNKTYRVLVGSEKRTILENVNLKVSDNYNFELHLDTDDGNASLLNQGDIGIILGE